MARTGESRFRPAMLLAVAALVSIVLLAWQFQRDAARSADRTLSILGNTWQLVQAQENRDLVNRGQLIAGNQAVIGYMTHALGSALPGEAIDHSSIVDLLEERRTQLGLDVAAVVDDKAKLVVATGRNLPGSDFSRDPVFTAALAAQAPRTGLLPAGGRPLHVVILPLAHYGSGDAYLLVGRRIGQEFVQAMASVGAGDVAIVATGSAGPTVVASTLDGSDSTALASAWRSNAIATGARATIVLPSGRVQAESAELFGESSARMVVLARAGSLASILAAHLPILLFVVLAWCALVAALAWHRRQVAIPLQALERLMRRWAETGDCHLYAIEQGTPLLVSAARAFNALTGARPSRDT